MLVSFIIVAAIASRQILLYVQFAWDSQYGHVVTDTAYAARDPESFLSLEEAVSRSASLATLARNSHGRIVTLTPGTQVILKRLYSYRRSGLTAYRSGDLPSQVIEAKIETGPLKNSVVSIRGQDVTFPNL